MSVDQDRNESAKRETRNMTPRTAAIVTWSVVGVCLLALLMIFQPFAIDLFSAGCIMVVVGGLIFNVIPFANTQNPLSRIFRVAAIVLAILVAAVAIAIGFVEILL